MPGTARSSDVQHHQAFLGNGGLHLSGLAHQGKGNGRQLGQNALETVLAGDFFLARSQEQKVIGLRRAAQLQKDLQQADHAGPRVVTAQPVEFAVGFQAGRERVAPPAADGFHGVDVRIEQQGGFLQVECRPHAPDVVALAAGVHPL